MTPPKIHHAGGRRKQSQPVPADRRGDQRRKNPPKRLKEKREKRADMQIIVSATQADIYAWALSIAIMAGILGVIATLAIVGS